MKKIFLLLIVGIMLTNCSNSQNEQFVEANPLWKELSNELELQFGQIVKINQNIKAVIIDVSKDEGGIWYGLCYLTDDGLFARQIPNGLVFTTCVDMLDATYLNESKITLITQLDLLSLSKSSIRIGSISPASTLNDLIRNYEYGLERREFTQTPCDEDVLGLNPVRECYFNLKKFEK